MNIAGKQENLQEKNMETKKDETAGKTARVVLNLNIRDTEIMAVALWEALMTREQAGDKTMLTQSMTKLHDRVTRGLEKQQMKEQNKKLDEEIEKKGIEAEAKANEAGESQ